MCLLFKTKVLYASSSGKVTEAVVGVNTYDTKIPASVERR